MPIVLAIEAMNIDSPFAALYGWHCLKLAAGVCAAAIDPLRALHCFDSSRWQPPWEASPYGCTEETASSMARHIRTGFEYIEKCPQPGISAKRTPRSRRVGR